MKNFLIATTILVNTVIAPAAIAETLTYQALTDFPAIEAGEVPYYKDESGSRDVLAINAAKAQYRNKFARATAVFDGAGGSYDVSIAALAEIDGEGDYRFLVNGSVVGTATNTRVEEDWQVQTHTFEDIAIPAGAEISVESNAVTNGLIPEGDITAYARGRWRTLTIANDSIYATELDLAISASVENASPTVDQSFELTLLVSNNGPDTTATSPVVIIEVPTYISIAAQSACSKNDNIYTCNLAEIAPQRSEELVLTATARDIGDADLHVDVTMDQLDTNPTNNTTTVVVNSQPATQSTATVDLAVNISSNVATAKVGDEIQLTLTTTNQHQSNTATNPLAGVLLPLSMTLSAGSPCTVSDQTVSCELSELPPGTSSNVEFSVQALRSGDALVVASAAAVESDDNISNNEARHTVKINDAAPSSGDSIGQSSNPATTQTGSAASNKSSSGGGSPGPFTLLVLLLLTSLARRLAGNRPR